MKIKYNYIFFTIIMSVILLVCFCFINVSGGLINAVPQNTGPTPSGAAKFSVFFPSPATAGKTTQAVTKNTAAAATTKHLLTIKIPTFNLKTSPANTFATSFGIWPSISSELSPSLSITSPPLMTPPSFSPNEALPTYDPNITSNPGGNNIPVQDLHGYVFYIAAPFDLSEDINVNRPAIDAFEQKYNCKVAALSFSNDVIYNMLLKSAGTGITNLDAIVTDSPDILVNYEPLGLLDEFSKYMTQDEINNVSASYKKILSKNNILYGIPAHAPEFSGLWLNNELLAKYNIANPVSVYESGNWNWDAFNNFIYSCSPAMTNSSLYGISTSSDIYLPMLAASGGGLFSWSGDKFISGVTYKPSVNGLTLMQNLYTNNFIASDNETYFYVNGSRSTAILAGETSMYKDIKRYLPKNNFTLLPYPLNPVDNKYLAMASYTDCAAIVKTSKHSAQTAELLKIIYGGDNFNRQIDNYTVNNNFTPQITSAYKNMLGNFTIDYSKTFDSSLILDQKIKSLLKNGTFSNDIAKSDIEPIINQVIAQKSKYVDLTDISLQTRW